MRYLDIETISFTDSTGKTVPIKEKRPIPESQISFEVDVQADIEIDEVASRETIFGEDSEDQSYRIFDANIIKIVESKYDLSRIGKLGIPL